MKHASRLTTDNRLSLEHAANGSPVFFLGWTRKVTKTSGTSGWNAEVELWALERNVRQRWSDRDIARYWHVWILGGACIAVDSWESGFWIILSSRERLAAVPPSNVTCKFPFRRQSWNTKTHTHRAAHLTKVTGLCLACPWTFVLVTEVVLRSRSLVPGD
jgi:hypothetical protein